MIRTSIISRFKFYVVNNMKKLVIHEIIEIKKNYYFNKIYISIYIQDNNGNNNNLIISEKIVNLYKD